LDAIWSSRKAIIFCGLGVSVPLDAGNKMSSSFSGRINCRQLGFLTGRHARKKRPAASRVEIEELAEATFKRGMPPPTGVVQRDFAADRNSRKRIDRLVRKQRWN